MNRRIARRDFLNGMAIAVTGAYADPNDQALRRAQQARLIAW